MRNKLVIGNWKMNTSAEEAVNLLVDIKALLPKEMKTVVCVPFTHIGIADEVVLDTNIAIGAQNVSEHDKGAFTGEISASMLRSLAVEYVIIGHSERRTIFGESNASINKKIKQTLDYDMQPVFCFGESLATRKEGNHLSFITTQINEGLKGISSANMAKMVLAYEPIWAIGTGETASPEQAQEVHAHIRKIIGDMYSSEVAESLTILYGGSVKPGNAKSLFECSDIDGGLIGGASLVAQDFVSIVNAI